MSCRVIAVVAVLAATAGGCSDKTPPAERKPAPVAEPVVDPYRAEREHLVDQTIERRGVSDPRVLEAMRSVPRHLFVPPDLRDRAYSDRALPIGFDLTISQPFIVATMTEAAKLRAGDRVLEIGTGSGYQAAVLAELGNEVYTIELHEQLARRTRLALDAAGYKDVQLRTGDGYRGWAEAAPFDAIIVTAAAPRIPEPLVEQLAMGGRMVIPVGPAGGDQYLQVVTRDPDGHSTESLFAVRFGPMLGEILRGR